MSTRWWFLIGLLALIGSILGHDLVLLVSLLLALIGGTSHLWARYCLAGVSYDRRFGSTRLFYGDETELAVQIVNAKPMPLAWLIAVDDFPADVELLAGQLITSHRSRRRLLVNSLSLRWYERVTRHYRLRARRRGAWEFGPVQLSSGDIFGFSVKRESIVETQTVIVYPKTVPLTALALPDRHPFGDFKTPRRLIEDPLRLVGAREYLPGDSFRHIHWKATAHQRDLQTKVFEPSAGRPLAIFLDARTSEYADEGIDRELLELAITTAASIARWAWEESYSVGLYVNSVIRPSRERIRIRPGKHSGHLIHILEALACLEEEGPWTLATILQLEAAALPYGTTVVAVTSLVNDRLLKALLELQRREHGATLVTLGETRLEASLPGIHTYHIGGREVWRELDTLALA
ncbi:MAG: DUF58 domain-containing protein [Chloroflexi bacterium]|nr:DUF58 domain-containing protein [Chloroflexota bacterium]MCI0729330.1 DUF58 domain-containing protein [Chloroflexota bacterium]